MPLPFDKTTWQYIIESLCEDEQFNTNVLKDVMDYTNFYSDAPETAKERVALRFLEKAVGPLPPLAIPSSSACSVDSSQRCEDVLWSYLKQKVVSTDTVSLNNDISQFILQKKATLPPLVLLLVKSEAEVRRNPPVNIAPNDSQNNEEQLHVHTTCPPGVCDNAPTTFPGSAAPDDTLNNGDRAHADAAHPPGVCDNMTTASPENAARNDSLNTGDQLHADTSCPPGVCDVAPAASEETLTCLKCNEGGPLFRCSRSHCQVPVHEKCLEGLSLLDGTNGETSVQCPLCLYYEAREAHRVAKNKALAFLGKDVFIGHRQRKYQNREQNVIVPQVPVSNGGEQSMEQGRENVQINVAREERNEEPFQAEQVEVEVEEQVNNANTSDGLTTNKEKRQVIAKERQVNGGNAGSIRILRPRVSRQSVCKRKRGQTEEAPETVSPREKRPRKKAPLNLKLRTIQLQGRIRKPWTPEEEEKLREGYNKLYAGGYVPWMKILEYGKGVFDDTRTPGDLKDKWRNILKKENRAGP